MLNKETASEFDYMFLIDASGSMANESTRYPGKTRWQELQETCFGLASEVNKIDSDGIDVIVFGGTVETFTNVTPQKIASVFSSRTPRGGTPLHLALDVVVKRQKNTGKNTVAFVFTDGEPDDQMKVMRLIVDASKKLDRDEQLTFLFIQIGKDPNATKFLQVLDDDLEKAGAKFDIVDTVSSEQADSMEPIDLINKAIAD